MTTVSDIYDYLNEFCPVNTQLSFDNAGLVIGSMKTGAERVILSLDVTSAVIEEAVKFRAGLIISHHPVIWNATKRLLDDDPDHRKYINLIKNDISVVSMHTNLDMALGGVNDTLLDILGADYTGLLDSDGVGRIGELRSGECSLNAFLAICKSRLNSKGLRYIDAGRPVRKIAVLGGSGAFALDDAYNKGCDTFITSDIKYDTFLRAKELGINLIDADHFCTENPVMFILQKMLSKRFTDVDFKLSEVHNQSISFF